MSWIALSIVSATPWPGWGAWSRCGAATSRPSASRPAIPFPGTPASSGLKARATPSRARPAPPKPAACARVAAHAGEPLVAGPLAASAAALGALEADDMRGQLTVRVEPERLREEAEPRLGQRPHRLGHRRA